jgi:hypothetical protein
MINIIIKYKYIINMMIENINRKDNYYAAGRAATEVQQLYERSIFKIHDQKITIKSFDRRPLNLLAISNGLNHD